MESLWERQNLTSHFSPANETSSVRNGLDLIELRPLKKLSLLPGLLVDHHKLMIWLITGEKHLRYSLNIENYTSIYLETSPYQLVFMVLEDTKYTNYQRIKVNTSLATKPLFYTDNLPATFAVAMVIQKL